jgi:hypothetical protein
MTDATQHAEHATPEPTFTEAPYSGNVRTRIHGYDWQLTVRAGDSKSFVAKVDGLMQWLDARTDKALNVEPPAPTITVSATTPVPAPATAAGPQRVQCVMIEIGTSYSGGKTQLKFNCNGLEHPLAYTKPIGDMVKLLAPLGFTAAHIVVGQKYPINCIVTYHESTSDGKTYKNVDKVEAA